MGTRFGPTPKCSCMMSACSSSMRANESSAALIRALPARFRTLAEKYGCAFVDGSAVTAATCSDQIHLTAEEHAVLGRLIADKLRELL